MAEDAKTGYNLRNDRPTADQDLSIADDNIIVDALCADYDNFKSRNCRQKSKLNLSQLRDWSQQKNLQTDNDSLLLIAEALRRSENNLRPLLLSQSSKAKSENWMKMSGVVDAMRC